VFTFLEIETFNLKAEVERQFYDPLIYFGESGLVFEEEDEDGSKAGE